MCGQGADTANYCKSDEDIVVADLKKRCFRAQQANGQRESLRASHLKQIYLFQTFLANNPLCGRCQPCFTRVGQTCEECGASTVAGNWLLFFLFSVGWVVFLVVAAGYPSSSSKKKIFLYFVQTLHLVMGPASSW